MFWGGYLKELKETGRNDTKHNPEIPAESIAKIQELGVLLLELMQCDKGDKKKYNKLVAKLPTNYQDEYHKLIQYVAYYIIGMHFARRGREGKAFQIFSVFFKGFFTLVD